MNKERLNLQPVDLYHFILDMSHKDNNKNLKFYPEKGSITPLRIQNLMFIFYGYILAKKNTLIFNEPFQAWEISPICQSVHEIIKKEGIKIKKYDKLELQKYDKTYQLLELLWEDYRYYTVDELTKRLKMDDGIWHKFYEPNKKNDIDFLEVKKYYSYYLEPFSNYENNEMLKDENE